MQLIVTNFFDDVLDNETVFDVVIDDEAVNLLALVSDEWILSFSAVVSDLENDSNAAIVVEALDLTLINFPCYSDGKMPFTIENMNYLCAMHCGKIFSEVEFISLIVILCLKKVQNMQIHGLPVRN